ncbi:HlyD family efflux transporter periplasmic adaptor subunit [Neisseria sp. Ec49-e6-T10]|uniref:HlyD family efflux transporter periplasmic adaptor subunit n=1 Tax=Neisseria sp. Ec49-e6-T10 TaxID=3140744 RepID=UPI003EB8ED32
MKNILVQNKKIILIVFLILVVITVTTHFYRGHSVPSNEITLYGNVDIRQTSLAFNSTGRIVHLQVQEGDIVKKGDILGQLDTEELELTINQTKAQIESQKQAYLRLKNGSRPEEIAQGRAAVAEAQAEVERVGKQLNRIEAINEQATGAVSQQEVDTQRANKKKAVANLNTQKKALALLEIGPRQEDIAQAQANLQSVEASLALMEYKLKESQLKSPIDAVVRARLVEVGDMVSSQNPVYTLAINSPKWIKAYINEVELGKVQQGMNVQVFIDSQPNQAIQGKIGYIASVAEFTPKNVQTEELRTSLVYEVRVYVEDKQDVLRLGMPATVKISVNMAK